MGYEIHLGRYSEDLKELFISKQEWLECAEKVGELKFVEGEFPESIQTYSEQYQEWIPVFWVRDDGSGFMRAAGFFQSDVSYERAIEIATHLKAIIYGDEGEIYFLPGYGVVVDDAERENPEVRIEDLRRLKPRFGNDYKRIIEAVEQEKRLARKQATVTQSPTKAKISTPKRDNKVWIIVAALIACLAVIYLIMN